MTGERIVKRPDLNTPADASCAEIVAAAVGKVAHEHHDGLGRGSQWVNGMREAGLYSAQLTMAALRNMGALTIEVDPADLSEQMGRLIPRGDI